MTKGFSETVFTRGGVSQNRQATIVACKGDIKIASLFETEAQDTNFSVEIADCDDVVSITLTTSDFALKRFDDLWDRTQDQLSTGLSELSNSCAAEIVEDELDLFWFKAAFQHVFETQRSEIEKNTKGS